MNIKVLASLGVVVALLTALLLASSYTSSEATIEDAPSVEAPEEVSAGPEPDSSLGGNGFGVETTVNVADQDISTTVEVAE